MPQVLRFSGPIPIDANGNLSVEFAAPTDLGAPAVLAVNTVGVDVFTMLSAASSSPPVTVSIEDPTTQLGQVLPLAAQGSGYVLGSSSPLDQFRGLLQVNDTRVPVLRLSFELASGVTVPMVRILVLAYADSLSRGDDA